MAKEQRVEFEVIEDYGTLGERQGWPVHLTQTQWGDNVPGYDIRPWNNDMTRMGKGIVLTWDELFELQKLIRGVLGIEECEDGEAGQAAAE